MTLIIKRDVPFVPSSVERLATMINLAGNVTGQKTIDLGSGDGRVVIAMAKLGATAYGYEIDPDLAIRALKAIKEANLDNQALIMQTNYWDEDLSNFDLVTIYGITSIMERLENKLRKELKPGARIVSNYFTFPNWKPEKIQNDVYLYIQH